MTGCYFISCCRKLALLAYDFTNLRREKDVHWQRDPFFHFYRIKVEILGPGFLPSISQFLDYSRICESLMVDIVLEVFDLPQAEQEVLPSIRRCTFLISLRSHAWRAAY
jgi:hypothetical protein